MTNTRRVPKLLALVIWAWSLVILAAACEHAIADPPPTGPETEKRFPPLVVPDGFQATLFACDPLIEYPSAIAVGPKERPGSLYVAIDYMTGLGTEIVRRDEIRLVEDTDGDGYADKATVYADGFNSIMGLTFHGGTVYVMHSPFLTALKDTNGDGQADERRDLLSGLGLPPEENDVRLHCANGIVMGYDGWLYLALGDHGCDVPRPEGDRLIHQGGGILRCRPDGRDLHLFATGLRNIYDVALDDDLNVFVRDNENDGGDYKIRVCYSFHGADHGYPYLYYERPDEALAPLADLGLGSSAGGAAYLEQQFPAEYRGSLFFCEWGKSVVNYRPQRTGSGFAPLSEIQFAAGAENDPYGFKPTDLVIDRDGSLVVADWCDGQRPKRGRGRIYRVRTVAGTLRVPSPDNGTRSVPTTDLIARLDSESYYARVEAQDAMIAGGPDALAALSRALESKDRMTVHGRMHAVWILARDGSDISREELFELATNDGEPRVQVQAIRALADLYDPVLTSDRLGAPPADAAICQRLAKLAVGKDPRVLLETVIAVGRLKWPEAPDWLRKTLAGARNVEPVLAHAAMQTLRRSGNWNLVLLLLDLPEGAPIRPIALRALAGQCDPEIAAGLIERLDGRDVQRRQAYAALLTRIWKQPGPWTYWGYRPSPRPANLLDWEKTKAIEMALDRVIQSADDAVRLAVQRQMQREQMAPGLDALAAWLAAERSEEGVAAILSSASAHPVNERREFLARIVVNPLQSAANRLRALELHAAHANQIDAAEFRKLVDSVEEGEVLAEVLKRAPADPLAERPLVRGLGSRNPQVRAAAVTSLARFNKPELGESIIPLLSDREPVVRASAATTAGKLKLRDAREPLLALASNADAQVRAASLEALTNMREPRAAPLAAQSLDDPLVQAAALACLAELGTPSEAPPVIKLAQNDLPESLVQLAARALTKWQRWPGVSATQRKEIGQALAELPGRSGLPVAWQTSGPSSGDQIAAARQLALAFPPQESDGQRLMLWPLALATGQDAKVVLTDEPKDQATWLAFTDVTTAEPARAQFLVSATSGVTVWINGKQVFQHDEPRQFSVNPHRFDAQLAAGFNRIVVEVAAAEKQTEFHLRFRRKSSSAQLEQLTQAAISRTGDVERGRKLFLDAAKTQCIKCHRIGNDGERIGPELTGLGDRFSRIHIIESILEPSRTVTPGFQTLLVRLADGTAISGVKVTEDEKSLTLADQKGEKHMLSKAEIDEQQPQPTSTMPDNLAQQFTADQFVDLVTFLVSQKQGR